MTIKNQKCICVGDTSRNPNRSDERADPKCYFCRGEGLLTIDVAHDPPPYQTGADWQATIQGSETGPMGCGSTKDAAVFDLMIRLWEVSN